MQLAKDKMSRRVRILAIVETEQIRKFSTNHTKYCLVKEEAVDITLREYRFMMGNELTINLVAILRKY